MDFHLHVWPFADDIEDGTDAPDFVADFVAFGKGVGHGVFFRQARRDGLGQYGDTLFPRHGRRAALGHGALAMVVFHELRRDFGQETAGHIGRDAAVHGPRDGIGHVELPFGPGNANIGQTPFFFDLRRVHQGPAVREQSFVEAGQEDDREFQALGGMEGHEGDFRVAAFKIIDIADQGDVF